MRIKSFLLFLTFFLCFTKMLFAQLPVGSKAPKIYGNTWLSKDGKETDQKGKFTVIEFWATWCIPCLEALPHLNELQRTFAGIDNLIFLSITDENISKISMITKRFKFNSTIVSDTSRKTSDNFQIRYLPTTYLIDEGGVIQWVGMPKDLTKELIKSFINKDLTPEQTPMKGLTVTAAINTTSDSLRMQYTNIFYDPLITQHFTITFLKNPIKGKSAQKITNRVYNRFELSIKLKNLLADLMGTSPVNIVLPIHLENQNISFCYKQDGLTSISDGKSLLLEKILQKEKLNFIKEEKKVQVYLIKIIDSAKLHQNRSPESSGVGNVSVSDDEKLVSIHNCHIQTLLKQLEISLNANIIFSNQAIERFLYDLTIDLKTYNALSNSLGGYGLSVSKQRLKMSRLVFEYLP